MDYDFKRYGLLYTPDLKDLNDMDYLPDWVSKGGYNVSIEFSSGDQEVLKNALLKIGDKCKAMLEIGVNKFPGAGSTHKILEQKPKDCKYLGVDIYKPRFDGLTNEAVGIYGLESDSSDYEKIVAFLKETMGVEQLDFIHIDGYHSVNQVLKDWRFTELLVPNGCVVMHDTNIHPGPVELIKSIDPTRWKVEQHYKGDLNDWGITVFWKL